MLLFSAIVRTERKCYLYACSFNKQQQSQHSVISVTRVIQDRLVKDRQQFHDIIKNKHLPQNSHTQVQHNCINVTRHCKLCCKDFDTEQMQSNTSLLFLYFLALTAVMVP